MSAHRIPQRRGLLSALAAQVADFVFESVDEEVEPQPKVLQPNPVVAVVAAASKCGATTVARLLAAELASRADGAAIATSVRPARRSAPPSRAAIRLATGLAGAAEARPCGRLCIVRMRRETTGGDGMHTSPPGATAAETAALINAARYLAPVVLDLPADGSAAGSAGIADQVVVIAGAGSEPALLDAVAGMIDGDALKVVNRMTEPGEWQTRGVLRLPDSRIAARAAAMGTRPLGPLGAAIAGLADNLEASR